MERQEGNTDNSQEGDAVSIVLDEDGNAATIIVQYMGMGGGQRKDASGS
ncbi:MAG: hypothetical protein IJF03_12430 [Lachnospiraceae bacterium]|nr:hypothetical protein [Lachnospiraceae bacterium]